MIDFKKTLILLCLVLCVLIGACIFLSPGAIQGPETPENSTNQSDSHTTSSTSFSWSEDLTESIGDDIVAEPVNGNDAPPIWYGEQYTTNFELPVKGATGYASIGLIVRKSPSDSSQSTGNLKPGAAFQILDEKNEWWQIDTGIVTGWVNTAFCMINLPDVIPSLIFDDTNASSSLFVVGGMQISGITGKKLYDCACFNKRLNREEYVVPILYCAAKKIAAAQKAAWADGNCLKIYEAFRPAVVQKKVFQSVKALAASNPQANNALNTDPWNIDWFIAEGISNHQVGYAVDLSLVKVKKSEVCVSGGFKYSHVVSYTEYEMPTQMHELSIAACVYNIPLPSLDRTAWKNYPYSSMMNTNARRLQNYMTKVGMTPLASEWWHFNDIDAYERLGGKGGNGNYVINQCQSIPMYPKTVKGV